MVVPRAEYEAFLRDARELLENNPFEDIVYVVIVGARQALESKPDLYGAILARGVRDEGTLRHAARGALDELKAAPINYRSPPTRRAARISARIFAEIAYKQPYFDGNKRTGLLAGTIIAMMLGFLLRDSDFEDLEEEIRVLSEKNASVKAVAEWFLGNVLIPPD